ncbi:peptide chain release factor 2 [Syntrophobacter fumaroxidans]|uniref:peptide chain release factor 2 n=1 Tax=Syntrophobacter fumaroxidans TaxID=119484 RepID=UPI0012373BA3|nr:peptide chain release factor 2 [Syntrophobacter fumaroxidans]
MTIDISDLKTLLRELAQRFQTLGGIFDIEGKRKRLKELEKILLKPGFWDSPEESKHVLKERSDLNVIVENWQRLSEELRDNELMLEMALEEEDREVLKDVHRKALSLQKELRTVELQQLLGEENDDKNAIVSINAGAGGTEAQDWAEMLLRMYLRWCEKKSFTVQMVDMLEGEEAGIKSGTFTVSGSHAYGLLKGESGIHRLVRISPFDASGRRHTSFAAVLVIPEVDEKIEVEIKQADLRIDTYRASGAGGQHVNKTSSAVRITHLPTGIVVQCQNEKSQHRNRDIALKILRARLYEREKRAQQEKLQEAHDSLDDIAWGNQIRSYVLQPYRLIKDHRTSIEKGNVEGVLDGEIDDFIEGYLMNLANARGRAAVTA